MSAFVPIRGKGFIRDNLDPRDHIYQLKRPGLTLEKAIDLRTGNQVPKVYDQHTTNSCTANAVSYALTFLMLNEKIQKAKHLKLPFSRMFIYYNTRLLEGTQRSDCGAQIRNTIKAVATKGACAENEWDFRTERIYEAPPETLYTEAENFLAPLYQKVDNTNKAAMVEILSEGYPLVGGIAVLSSFESRESAKTGIIPMPNVQAEQYLGGHALTFIGYNPQDDTFLGVNSWSTDWGKDGYFTIPAAYLCSAQLASDFWVIKEIL